MAGLAAVAGEGPGGHPQLLRAVVGHLCGLDAAGDEDPLPGREVGGSHSRQEAVAVEYFGLEGGGLVVVDVEIGTIDGAGEAQGVADLVDDDGLEVELVGIDAVAVVVVEIRFEAGAEGHRRIGVGIVEAHVEAQRAQDGLVADHLPGVGEAGRHQQVELRGSRELVGDGLVSGGIGDHLVTDLIVAGDERSRTRRAQHAGAERLQVSVDHHGDVVVENGLPRRDGTIPGGEGRGVGLQAGTRVEHDGGRAFLQGFLPDLQSFRRQRREIEFQLDVASALEVRDLGMPRGECGGNEQGTRCNQEKARAPENRTGMDRGQAANHGSLRDRARVSGQIVVRGATTRAWAVRTAMDRKDRKGRARTRPPEIDRARNYSKRRALVGRG